MDGWGKELDPKRSAIAQASTPFVDSLYKNYPHSLLQTYGEAVGLPEGQMGNSEVGHMNLGAGRIVYQELQRINKSITDGLLQNNKTLVHTFEHAKKNNTALHLIGLVSNGGVHSHINHLKALCRYAKAYGLEKVFIHCFMDGRDCAPDSGYQFIKELEESIANGPCKIATIVGRYYAMDRDKRWERIQKAYNLLVNGTGTKVQDALSGIQESYAKGVKDEFIEPIVVCKANGDAVAKIKDKDAVLCFNFRTDRCREITEVLSQNDLHEFNMHKLNLYYTTMTNYDATFKKVQVIFEKDNLINTLGEILARAGKTQLRIAETEKYPHVSYFFSGERIMVSSPKVATYDLQAEMSASELKDKAITYIQSKEPDFMCLNFANTDMVGHTGVFKAAVKAAETVDACVKEVINTLLAKDYAILLTADHGNADIMINEDGTPHTSHTMNLVPLFFISNEKSGELKDGKLGDLAPTLLSLMGIDKPKEMTGDVLL
jgi:2,3-bisphosphoglycerate-independent phosphoglycerate mutase